MSETIDSYIPSIAGGTVSEEKGKAIEIIMRIPDGSMAYVMGILKNIEALTSVPETQTDMKGLSHTAVDNMIDSQRLAAFQRLEALIKPIQGLDEKKELAEWREEKFGYADPD